MNNLIKYLEQLELSEMEAKFYLKLFETGPISIVNLAQALGMKRTTAYLYIDPLINKGLAVRVVKGSKKLIAPCDPESLQSLLDKRVSSTKALQEKFPDVLQEIKGIFPHFTEINDIEIKYLKGIHNARKIYIEALNSLELRAYVKIKETETLFPENVPVFEDAFKNNKNLKVWEIIYDSASTTKDAEQVEDISDRYFYKFMPKHLKLTSEDILIYDGKVAIINYKGWKTSIILQSSDFYNNLKELFDLNWEMLPSQKSASK